MDSVLASHPAAPGSTGSHYPLDGSTGPKWKMSRFVLKKELCVKIQNKEPFVQDQYYHLAVKAPHSRPRVRFPASSWIDSTAVYNVEA